MKTLGVLKCLALGLHGAEGKGIITVKAQAKHV